MGAKNSIASGSDSHSQGASSVLQMPESVDLLSSGFLMNWASEAHKPLRPQSPALNDKFDQPTQNISRDVMEAIEASLKLDATEEYASSPRAYVEFAPEIESNSSHKMPPDSSVAIPITPPLTKVGHNGEITYGGLVERIWRFNDQNASLYLQERLRYAVPKEGEEIIAAVNSHVDALMIHRFGNFLVQCMLELARPGEVAQFATRLSGKVSKISRHQFGCHVVQKLLDVSTLVIQARVVAELLDDAIATMSSSFGTHVWQKLLHLPWSPELPSVTTLANNAVHLESKKAGWMAVVQTEGGAATIKSYLSLPQLDSGRQECINELLSNISTLIKQPHGSQLVCKLMMMTSTRARAMTLIFSKAYEYCTHPVSSSTLIHLIKLKVPSFPVRLSAAIAPYNSELARDKYGTLVLASLSYLQNGH